MACTRSLSQLRATMRAWVIQSAGPCRLAASFLTCRSSCLSCAARARSILGISSLLFPFGNSSFPILSSFNELSSRGCTKRPEKPFCIVEILLAYWANSQINTNVNVCRLLRKEPDRPKQLINGVRPHKPFRTASSAAFLIDAIIPARASSGHQTPPLAPGLSSLFNSHQ